MARSSLPWPFTPQSACATCSPNGRPLNLATPAFWLARSACCSFSSVRVQSLRWCCHDRIGSPPERALDRRARAPALRPGACDFPSVSLLDAWACNRRRSLARKFSALERAAAGEGLRKWPHLSAHGAHVGRRARAPDRESRLAPSAKRVGDRRGGSLGGRRLYPAGAYVLMLAWLSNASRPTF